MIKKTINQKIYLIIFSLIIVWLTLSFVFSYSSYKALLNLASYNKLSFEERNLNLYGADYEIYQKLQKDTKIWDAKIIYLIPDIYYLPKSVFFLYPKQIKTIGNINELDKINLLKYDFLLIYNPEEKYSGVIKGLDSLAKKWDLKVIFQYYKKLNKNNEITYADFLDNLEKNRGLLLINLKKS